MTGLERLHAAIKAAPAGPDTIAAFDLDGTLISGYSASVVYRDRLRRFDISLGELLRTTGAAIDTQFRGADVGALMDIAVRALTGRTEEELNDWGERLFRQEIAAMIYPDAREILAAHRKAGHTVVMATSATPFQARGVAADLDIEDVLCTEIEVIDGMLTGDLSAPALWGPAKADALAAYAEKRGVDLRNAFAYSNGAEDVPMLESVGRPVALNPDRTLASVARRKGWPSVTLRKPQRGATPLSTVRTATAMGALAATAVVGFSAGLVTGNRQLGANLVGTYGPDISLSLLGIDVEIDGEHNIWDHRPAVFMFNHQSSLDLLVLGTVIKRDVTGVAKKEAANDPRFIPIGALLDVAYIDRSNTAKAKAALQPAVDKLKNGVSIVIAPEGTRSATPKLGAFKKGAFHLAMQAGVPIVPVVIHNAGERMWRNSLVAHPGPVYVSVLDPISTTGWQLDDLDSHIEEVRSQFDAALTAGHP
ncbi:MULTISPECIES: HAD-IB family hydrolase [Rhodococcus]|uniref:1-acyl-sn-glycerol-3-phosphate acyltransferase n=1 Tax=Nocardia globerula TaxID=1818 RepID=A0A652YWF2_NOCGL|nr:MULTISPECIES: HAD-IB family hydrolase [Rhodococcus]MDV8069914.1 HAD-IB family hydrolase [Rhodococcus sp. IEGM 1366]NMD59614.1 HAD-IB family hydrolase [Nocardia globerula]PVX64306.1 putative phosphoserine phosphatase/1-acylglycerol-3-phosphate O-acyltransferase [Rhodococcus globerulus]QXW04406.1 HAD-IB family hydrolase [Rhodococcus globerulus]